MGILTFLDKENHKSIIKDENIHILYDLLSDDNKSNEQFFQNTIQDAKKDQTKEVQKDIEAKLDKYKEVYIHAVSIISLLHVNFEDGHENCVAHYRTKKTSQKMLIRPRNKDGSATDKFNVSTFQLGAINYSNDLTEGMTLLHYLFGKEKCPARTEVNQEYGAFASSFIFNPNCLNQFRLYGKEDAKEGTGVSLVFDNDFFSPSPKMATEPTEKEMAKRHALYRCIYIDPETQRVETVGHKEKHLFYQEYWADKKKPKGTMLTEEEEQEVGEQFEEYRKYIEEVETLVKDKLKQLRESINNEELDHAIVGRLLINLRYLTKHIAFKEEQECRIVRICSFVEEKDIKISEDFKRMYLEYLPIPKYVKKIYFGPKATEMEIFQDMLKHEGLNIPCEQSEHPWA